MTAATTTATTADTPKVLLDVNGIEVIYNHVILVLKGVSLQVPEGKIVALLGANGAGKTTTLRAISNLLKGERGDVTKGHIQYRDQRIEKLSPAELVKRGVVQVMEGRHCFAHLTIEENLLTGAYTRDLGRGDTIKIGTIYACLLYTSHQLGVLRPRIRCGPALRQGLFCAVPLYQQGAVLLHRLHHDGGRLPHHEEDRPLQAGLCAAHHPRG